MKGYNRILAESARESFERMYGEKKKKTNIWKYVKWIIIIGIFLFITIKIGLI